MNQLEVDARGLRCPLPVIRLATAARDAPAGTRITVLATDPAARHDIPAWCRMRGNELFEMTEIAGSSQPDLASSEDGRPDVTSSEDVGPAYLRFVVLVRAQSSKAAGDGAARARPSTPR